MISNDVFPVYNCSLYGLNTFGFYASAECLVSVTEASQLPLIIGNAALPRPFRVLGSGSNILLTGNVTGTVILNRIKGITVEREDEDHVWLRVGAGEIWHQLVQYAIDKNWGGIENLALIPGTVGAAPIQNIGAYGVEVKDTIEEVEIFNLEQKEFNALKNEECLFAYRDSIFKKELKDQVVVCSVLFKLRKKPELNTDYGAISDELKRMNEAPSIQSVANAVMNIRRSKLPDPAEIPNAGSFFKNPAITLETFESLRSEFPGIPHYPAGDLHVKIPAAWLIEQCGWKGFRRGDAGVHEKQALVLVNHENADGSEIWLLSEDILKSVEDRFDILLEREVQVW